MKACFIIGLVLLTLGGCSLTNSFLVQQRFERVPRMTCAELARQGAPADGQVLLTDVIPCSQLVATRLDGDLYLYVPAYSAGLAQEPEPAELGFLMQIWNDEDRRRLLGQVGPVEAVCWATKGARVMALGRGPGDIETWARDELERKYPGIRLPDMWVLTFGHANTPTAERVRSAWRYGIGEVVLGVGALVCGMFLKRLASPRAAANAQHGNVLRRWRCRLVRLLTGRRSRLVRFVDGGRSRSRTGSLLRALSTGQGPPLRILAPAGGMILGLSGSM